MTLSRGVILITAIMLGIFGLMTLIKPDILAGNIGVTSPTINALSEFRTIYGGIAFGIACFLFYAFRTKNVEKAALLLTALILSFASIGRALSILLDGIPDNQFIAALFIEILGASLAVFAIYRTKETA